MIDAYVKDLRFLLEESSIMEQKVFLPSFIQSLAVAETDLTITYTIPIDSPNCGEGVTEDATVLPIIKSGSPGGEPYSATLVSHPAFEVGLRPDQSIAWSKKKAPLDESRKPACIWSGSKVASKDLENARSC